MKTLIATATTALVLFASAAQAQGYGAALEAYESAATDLIEYTPGAGPASDYFVSCNINLKHSGASAICGAKRNISDGIVDDRIFLGIKCSQTDGIIDCVLRKSRDVYSDS